MALFAGAPAFAQPAAGGKAALSADEVDERISRMKDTDQPQSRRLEAVIDLGKDGTKAAKKALRKALRKEKNPQVKARMVEAFGEKPDQDGVEELSDIARGDASSDSRTSAVRALGFARDEAVVPLLIEKFNDEKEELGVRLRAADALTRYPSDAVFNVYVKALESPAQEIRLQAMVSMFNAFGYDKPRVRPYVERMVKDPHAGGAARTYLNRLQD